MWHWWVLRFGILFIFGVKYWKYDSVAFIYSRLLTFLRIYYPEIRPKTMLKGQNIVLNLINIQPASIWNEVNERRLAVLQQNRCPTTATSGVFPEKTGFGVFAIFFHWRKRANVWLCCVNLFQFTVIKYDNKLVHLLDKPLPWTVTHIFVAGLESHMIEISHPRWLTCVTWMHVNNDQKVTPLW